MTVPRVTDRVLLLRGKYKGKIGRVVGIKRRGDWLYFKVNLALSDIEKEVWLRGDALKLHWPLARYYVGGRSCPPGMPHHCYLPSKSIEIAAGPLPTMKEFFIYAGYGDFLRYTHSRIPLKKKYLHDLANTLRHLAGVIEEYAKENL